MPDYLQTIRDSYFGCCSPEFKPDGFTVYCSGNSHGQAGQGSYHIQEHQR